MKPLVQNRKAQFNYIIKDDIEAGMSLTGPIVKSIYAGQLSIATAYLQFLNDRPYLVNCKQQDEAIQIPLLLNKKEIKKIKKFLDQPGNTMIPLKIYRKRRHYLKVLLGWSTGRKKQDKRQYLKEKDAKKQLKNIS